MSITIYRSWWFGKNPSRWRFLFVFDLYEWAFPLCLRFGSYDAVSCSTKWNVQVLCFKFSACKDMRGVVEQ